jgi:hypothetical protein
MNLRFPSKREIVEEGKAEDFVILGALFKIPAMVSIKGQMTSNECTFHFKGDLGVKN